MDARIQRKIDSIEQRAAVKFEDIFEVEPIMARKPLVPRRCGDRLVLRATSNKILAKGSRSSRFFISRLLSVE